MEFALSPSPIDIRKLWTREVSGLMTDLAVSRDGSAILLARIPNPENRPGSQESGRGLTRYDPSGKVVWHLDLNGAVKSIALSDDGKLALVSTYDNEVLGIDVRGKVRWTVEGMCKPVPMGKRFICYHDDDAEPGVAFDVYSNDGAKVLSYPITRDVLALKVADDQRHVAIALEGGQVLLFGAGLRSVWQRQVDGEVVDLAVSSGSRPHVGVLFNVAPQVKGALQGSPQAISVFGFDGKSLGEAGVPKRAGQLEAVAAGTGLALYGNSEAGQLIAYYAVGGGGGELGAARPPLAEKWRREYPRAADYSSSMITSGELIILGFEDIIRGQRNSHLIAFDLEGGLKWNLPLPTEDGAYLYAHGFAPMPSLIAVGTDDGYLSAFRLVPAKKQEPGVSGEEGAQARVETPWAVPATLDPAEAAAAEEALSATASSQARGTGEEFDPSVPSDLRTRLWLSEGGALAASDGERFPANRFGLGVGFNWGPELRWMMGLSYAVFSSSENAPDVGSIHRRSTLMHLGAFILPQRLYAKLLGGVQTLSGSAAISDGTSFAWTGGLAIGTRFEVTDRFNLGVEASCEIVSSAATAPLLDIDAPHGRFPAAGFFSLSLVAGLDFGKLR